MSSSSTRELEELVRVLSAGLGFDHPVQRIPDAVRRHLAAGETAEAVKAMREDLPGHRIGLLAATRMVRALET